MVSFHKNIIATLMVVMHYYCHPSSDNVFMLFCLGKNYSQVYSSLMVFLIFSLLFLINGIITSENIEAEKQRPVQNPLRNSVT